jgi:hypothetical protein
MEEQKVHVIEIDTSGLPAVQDAETERHAPVVETALAVVVDSNDALEECNGFLVGVVRAIKSVEDVFKEPKRETNGAHKSVCAAEKKVLEPLRQAEKHLRGEGSRWAMKVERERLAALRAQAEEQERRAVEARERAAAEEEVRLAAAVEADDGGLDVFEPPATTPEPEPEPEPEPLPELVKTDGVSYRTVWSGEIYDEDALVRACLTGAAPRGLIVVDLKALKALAESTKGVTRYPGIKWVSEQRSVVRG